ncbi:aminotransferase class I/II-fold pyridoxal phosphate-dependent enzyme [Kitasatospora sp. NPDC056076]|uniref:aminotransferase class I/II-fold pyridoxal phosphate-dependent enzyme n=1 Tax=Kitasatospora sp. NPDC056076 TaxID=3345703 RepID=UPI0035D6E0E9
MTTTWAPSTNPYSDRWTGLPPDVIPLTSADMDETTDPAVLHALQQRLAHPLVYPPPYTTSGIADTIAGHYRSRYGAAVARENILLTSGTLATIGVVLTHWLRPGDEALYLAPSYPPLPDAIARTGATPVPVPLNAAARPALTRAGLETLVTPRTRAFLLANPHNPTGRMLTHAELTAIAETARAHDLRILSDEVHSRVILDPARCHIPIATLGPDTARRTLTLDAATKSHNLAAIGGAVLWTPDTGAIDDLRHRFGSNLPAARAIQQAALAAAYATDSPWLTGVLARLRERQAALAAALEPHRGQVTYRPGEATYFAWLDFGTTFGARPAAAALADHGLLLEPGTTYGAPRTHARLTFATTPNLFAEALRRLTAALGRPERTTTR